MVDKILSRWVAGEKPTVDEEEKLLAEELAKPATAKAFGITKVNGFEKIQQRSRLFSVVYPEVVELCTNFGIQNSHETQETLWKLWLPIAIQLAEKRQQLQRPFIQGILGGQGTGKTTLTAILKLILQHFNYPTLTFSLDDLYKTYLERERLKQQDSRLIWRGPPGTHDVKLGIDILDQLRQPNRKYPLLIPRFDKSLFGGKGDRSEPERVDAVDLILFEGWFVGVRPINDQAFLATPPPIITPEDRKFAQDCHQKLKEYLPLWEQLDSLMVLYPVDYRLSKKWRQEAEQKMVAQGKSGMSDEEVEKFVEYFWISLHPELFITPLLHNSEVVDLVVEIDRDRTPKSVYQPSAQNS
ncbi:MAG: glycerate kinase [Oscillatoria sp. PMC 1068.18]|nr:glycerate kinase [Oscillatoria sp. PMC 1076.18]MEC4989887.1 glycerate kinase [Oscillatoria sp. PMC 1068.18]